MSASAPTDSPTDAATETVPVPTAGATAASTTAGPAGREPGDRGGLQIAWSVVRRIAEHAADLTEGTTVVHRRLAGFERGASGSSAKISGYGDQVDVRLEVPLVYPAPIGVTVEAVRGNVRDRVEALTGYRVRSLDVTVSALADPVTDERPTGRVE